LIGFQGLSQLKKNKVFDGLFHLNGQTSSLFVEERITAKQAFLFSWVLVRSKTLKTPAGPL